MGRGRLLRLSFFLVFFWMHYHPTCSDMPAVDTTKLGKVY